MKIAIAVTEHNRPDTLKTTLEYIHKYKAHNSDVFIVDDASNPPTPDSDYRFNENVGISVAKNKCLELTQDYDYVFLFDSDCYPIKHGFEQLYIDSGLEHAMYIFKDFATSQRLNDTRIIRSTPTHIEYSHTRGCMLFYTRKAIDTVGGMRPQLKKWGFEHGELSDRIYNNGLTPSPYCDVHNSNDYIYSLDEHQTVSSTVKGIDRINAIASNLSIYNKFIGSTDYVPLTPSAGRNVIITTYFTGEVDTQRGTNFEVSPDNLSTLSSSCKDYEFVVLNDCFDFGVRVECDMNPYYKRWFAIREWLLNNPDVNYIWMVDATDVELLRDPFELTSGVLYIGYEYGNLLYNQWMVNNSAGDSKYINWLRVNSQLPLLNCGVVGGSRDIVLEFLNIMTFKLLTSTPMPVDMQWFNYVIREHFSNRFITGDEIVTKFKKFEYNTKSIWKHK